MQIKTNIFLIIIFLLCTLNIFGQVRQRRAIIETYNFAVGARAGELTGVEGKFYLGGTVATKKRSAAFFKNWAIQLAYGKEYLIRANSTAYRDRFIVPGGNRFDINFLKYLLSTNNYELQIYGGLGLQLGNRRYKSFETQSDTHYKTLSASGVNIILGGEGEMFRAFLNRQKTNFLIFTGFLEARGYVDLAPELGWYYIRYAAGIRFNFWR